jgi:hypothetical protein
VSDPAGSVLDAPHSLTWHGRTDRWMPLT